MKAVRKCQWCDAEIRERDVIGINKKILGERAIDMYCMDCLAEYCGCTIRDLEEKIEQFKEEGCILFS